MGRVEWSGAALADVDAITDYVAAFNLEAAKRLRSRVVEAGDSLAEFPLKGRPLRGAIRAWSIVYPYVIRYRVSEGVVTILRVRHGARLQD